MSLCTGFLLSGHVRNLYHHRSTEKSIDELKSLTMMSGDEGPLMLHLVSNQ